MASILSYGFCGILGRYPVERFRRKRCMAKMTKPQREDEVLLPQGQTRPVLHRYWVQVDRQTKSSYPTLLEAETAGKAIKASHPNLQVGIYDAEESQVKLITA
jgi:hypothetical protein